jgi:hypothetical protein
MKIQSPSVPNLPLPKDEYSKLYLAQLTNVLRLYFNQLNDAVTQITNQAPSNTVYTVSTLPDATASGVGARAFVTDSSVSTFGTTVASGGSSKVPVYSDGVDWKIG